MSRTTAFAASESHCHFFSRDSHVVTKILHDEPIALQRAAGRARVPKVASLLRVAKVLAYDNSMLMHSSKFFRVKVLRIKSVFESQHDLLYGYAAFPALAVDDNQDSFR
jgi:hypothetical protein